MDRLAKQLTHELVLDDTFINQSFTVTGGAKGLDKVLGGQLAPVMATLAETLWLNAA